MTPDSRHPGSLAPAPAARVRHALAPMALLLAVGALLLAQVAPWHHPPPRATAAAAWPVKTSGAVAIGVTTPVLARNEWREWSPAALASINAFERHVRHHVGVIMWYADWAHNPRPNLAQLRAVAARGSVPEITWEPWDYTRGPSAAQPAYTLASIIDGRHDALIRTWARDLARYGGPVRLRFAQEMNGRWYPWSEVANGNHPGQYVRAWRHVHDLFTSAGARNVQWVWSPVAITVHAEQYPGNAYVDWVGLSGFNGGSQLHYGPWRSFTQLFGPSLKALAAIAPDKPIEISEVGTAETGGDKATWITQMFATLARNPQIRSVVWFNLNKVSDWRVESSPAALTAFRSAVANPRYR